MFHRNGPYIGQPRGYGFVTYMRKEDAISAKKALHNLLVGQKNIVVTSAHTVNNDELDKPRREEVIIPALAMSKEAKKTNRISQIQAIEAKLKLMEKKQEDELKINDTVATKKPFIAPHQTINRTQTISSNGGGSTSGKWASSKVRDKYNKPYAKSKMRR
ncbi:unnamed protein product [Phaedon cochleariae]|uniref:RRM domain-containing protein n=1 Tax=Phaedon cochleariae TaxID=80249 RepID=A0A9P0GQ04_PHACE|nr:unnamed protein product [Phaedon cochleariae]